MEFSVDTFTAPTAYQNIYAEIDQMIRVSNGCLAKAYIDHSPVSEDGIVLRGAYETISGIIDRYADNQLIVLPIDTSACTILDYQTIVIFPVKSKTKCAGHITRFLERRVRSPDSYREAQSSLRILVIQNPAALTSRR